MKKLQLTTDYTLFENIHELPDEDKYLMDIAIDIRNKAYAPYSHFNVGAAILLDNGKIVTGSNQENAAYPSGMCAERVAIFSAGAQYPNAIITKIAISASSSHKKVEQPVAPCGACRQTIAEYEFKQDQPIKILFMGESGNIIKVNSLKSLLPLGFDKTFL
ncbi:MAG: cytidine deaminase [Flavobacteriaceae bacterium]|jgi:cytidine deaminase|nr:cytidine deaminase [Flavobacteriaceae bacterium]MCB0484760.1 cytidine deaminase [Flavobacteriaceae bacterium]